MLRDAMECLAGSMFPKTFTTCAKNTCEPATATWCGMEHSSLEEEQYHPTTHRTGVPDKPGCGDPPRTSRRETSL